jgi:hypothetical protein
MSVSNETGAERKSGVAVIKAEYVLMFLNLFKYNFLMLLHNCEIL